MYARAEGDTEQDMTSVSDQLLFSSGGIFLGRAKEEVWPVTLMSVMRQTNASYFMSVRKTARGLGLGGGNIHEQVNKKQNNRLVVIKTLTNQTRPNKIRSHSHSASVTIFRVSALYSRKTMLRTKLPFRLLIAPDKQEKKKTLIKRLLEKRFLPLLFSHCESRVCNE